MHVLWAGKNTIKGHWNNLPVFLGKLCCVLVTPCIQDVDIWIKDTWELLWKWRLNSLLTVWKTSAAENLKYRGSELQQTLDSTLCFWPRYIFCERHRTPHSQGKANCRCTSNYGSHSDNWIIPQWSLGKSGFINCFLTELLCKVWSLIRATGASFTWGDLKTARQQTCPWL